MMGDDNALTRVKRRLAAGGNNGREVLSVINELEGVLNEQSRLLADVCDCMIKGGDGKPLTYGWKITGLNLLRPRLLPFRRWGN